MKIIIRFTCILFCICCLLAESYGQKKAQIHIVNSDSLIVAKDNHRANRFIGNVKLKHSDMIMTCDSLHQYADSNYIEAFGRVHAVQNDTLNLWGNFVYYNGNTSQAKVRNNVVMTDPKIRLTTDSLDYNVATRIGYYFNGGTIQDTLNKLTSDLGYYFVSLNELFFKNNVKVTSPDYTMDSDTLKYHTLSKVISIVGPTTIQGDNRTLYSEYGWYNTLSSHAEMYKHNRISYNTYIGHADTLVVDSITNSAILRKNINLYDTINRVIVAGDYGKVLKNNDYAYVTDRAMLIMTSQNDSLFIHGDTLSISKDSVGNNVMKAYHHTKFFSQELQGRCDSIVYTLADSTVRLFREPIIWASGNQLTATDISMHMSNNEVDRFYMYAKAMIVNLVDSTMYKLDLDQRGKFFNQIKGRDMTGYVKDNQLYMMIVDGSGESIFYPDDKGVIIGMNKALSSKIKIELENKKVKEITFITKAEGTLNPLFMVKPEDSKLKDFEWHIEKKPLKKEDIFN